MADGSIDIISPEQVVQQTRVRARTVSVKRLSKKELERGYYETIHTRQEFEADRPTHRADCLEGGKNELRPCPWVSCKYHLKYDVSHNGAIKDNFPHMEIEELPETCALDVANDRERTLEELGALTNMTRERIRQIETIALDKIRATDTAQLASDYADDPDVSNGGVGSGNRSRHVYLRESNDSHQ